MTSALVVSRSLEVRGGLSAEGVDGSNIQLVGVPSWPTCTPLPQTEVHTSHVNPVSVRAAQPNDTSTAAPPTTPETDHLHLAVQLASRSETLAPADRTHSAKVGVPELPESAKCRAFSGGEHADGC